MTLEVEVRVDSAEWWLGGRRLALVDRERLQRWLERPEGEVLQDDLELVATRWGIVVASPGRLLPTPLRPTAVADLRDRLQGRR